MPFDNLYSNLESVGYFKRSFLWNNLLITSKLAWKKWYVLSPCSRLPGISYKIYFVRCVSSHFLTFTVFVLQRVMNDRQKFLKFSKMFSTISIDWFKISPEQEQILNSEIKLEWKLYHAIFKAWQIYQIFMKQHLQRFDPNNIT